MSGDRCGRFTASVFGKLMAEPRTVPADVLDKYAHLVPDEIGMKVMKSGPRKGETVRVDGFSGLVKDAMREKGIILFGDTARSLIAAKAGEKRSGRPDYHPDTRSTDRGTLLEHAARIILSHHWTPIEGATWMPYGKDGGATPDGLLYKGTETDDLKCPESFGDVIEFDQLPDGDFDALLSWNRDYAWQIMYQAKCAGVRFANLTYFTDRLDTIQLPAGMRQQVQDVMDYVAYRLGEVTNRPWSYTYETDGFYYATKRYELTEERSKLIDTVLNAAAKERDALVEKMNAKVAQPLAA